MGQAASAGDKPLIRAPIGRQIATLWRLMGDQRPRYVLAILALGGATLVGLLVPVAGQIGIDSVAQVLIQGGAADTPASGQPLPALPSTGAADDSAALATTPTAAGALASQPAVASPVGVAALSPMQGWIDSLGGSAAVVQMLWLPALAMVLLAVGSNALMYANGWLASLAAETVCRRLRDRVYDHLQHLPMRYHDQADSGDLLQRCTSDIETVRTFLSQQVVQIGRAVLLVLLVLPLMVMIDWFMTIIALALIPVIAISGGVFFFLVKDRFQRADEAEGAMTSVLTENLTGIRVVRAFARQDFEQDKFARRNGDYRDHQYHMHELMAAYWSGSDLLCLIQVMLVLLVGSSLILSGDITVGTLYTFMAMVQQMLWPVRQSGRVLTDSGKAVVAIGRLAEILDSPVETQPLPPAGGTDALPTPITATATGTPAAVAGKPLETNAAASLEADAVALAAPARAAPSDEAPKPLRSAPVDGPGPTLGDIVIRGLRFNHGDKTVLDGIDLTIRHGTTLALLGPSGAGKTTLVSLLLRLYDYEHGSITVGGQELRDIARQVIRGKIGSVLQEPFLFGKSLRENIRLARHDADDQRVVDAASAACIHETITSTFEQKYDTLIGERGVTLSGGQRQRVAIARALIREAPILIFDDALSAVDTRNEAQILAALRERAGRQTTILIAHRLSTLMLADQTVVLDRGRIVQQGTHDTLVEQDGLYRKLWQIQSDLEQDLQAELATT